ncbi:MAG: hypothetical protein IJR97_03010 [Clostridia bacterium]|nr:hypothetical protein [Clostridia bacterium]
MPMNITIDPDLLSKLGAEKRLWSASHYDGSKNRINEDAILEAGTVSLGILTALALWCRKKFRNRGKTKEDLAAEKEAARINDTCGALKEKLLEYFQAAQKGRIDGEDLDDLIDTLDEMQKHDEAGKLSAEGRQELAGVQKAVAQVTRALGGNSAPEAAWGTTTQSAGGFGAVRDELIRQRDLLKG